MASREDLIDWVYKAVQANGGRTKLVNVSRHIWENHEPELRKSGDLFYKWQYEMRWAAQRLRDTGRMTLIGRDWAIKN